MFRKVKRPLPLHRLLLHAGLPQVQVLRGPCLLGNRGLFQAMTDEMRTIFRIPRTPAASREFRPHTFLNFVDFVDSDRFGRYYLSGVKEYSLALGECPWLKMRELYCGP